MLDGNISVEEDTELRDLVMQTLENNGVLAKVRAELRASVFLALEEQETVVNPVPLLNKTVKQYLASLEGKLLFSLVREFLEYFGLNYTISVYDAETYCGKEYDYIERNKLSKQLGINSTEPLLGEILKNTINGAFDLSRKSNTSRIDSTLESSTHVSNATFEVSVPKVLTKGFVESAANDIDESHEDRTSKLGNTGEAGPLSESIKKESLIKFNESATENPQRLNKEDLVKPKMPRSRELHVANNRNSLSKTMYFDEIIVDGKKEKVDNAYENESLFSELPPLKTNSNSIFSNLPPLNGKKETNINDVKEVMERVAVSIDNYEEDFLSPSGSTNEQSPSKEIDKAESLHKLVGKTDDLSKTVQSDEISEEIDELLTSTSCLDNIAVDNNSLSKFTMGLTGDCYEEV